MTIAEFYELIEEDYTSVAGRLHKEEKIRKYLIHFAELDYHDRLNKSFDSGNMEDAYMAATELRDAGGMLGFSKLQLVLQKFCTKCGSDDSEGELSYLKAKAGSEYLKIVDAIEKIK